MSPKNLFRFGFYLTIVLSIQLSVLSVFAAESPFVAARAPKKEKQIQRPGEGPGAPGAQKMPQGAADPVYVPAPPGLGQKGVPKDDKDRWSVSGIVNDDVILVDHEMDDRLLHIPDGSILDNGCVIKYPKILCGAEAKRIIADRYGKKDISSRVAELAKEKGLLTTENNRLKKKVAEFEERLKDLPSLQKAAKELEIMKVETKPLDGLKADIRALKTERLELTQDLGVLAHHMQKMKAGEYYKTPEVGPFNVVATPQSMYVFLYPDQRPKADKYFNSTIKRAYQDESLLLYVLDKKQISTTADMPENKETTK